MTELLKKKWLERSSVEAQKRWHLVAELPFLPRERRESEQEYQQRIGQQILEHVGTSQKRDMQWWVDHIRKRLVDLDKLGLLQWGEHQRVVPIEFRELSRSDQKRLESQGLQRALYAISVKAPKDQPQQKLSDRCLRFNPGKRLTSGQLTLLVFIDEKQERPVGMNVQLRGHDLLRDRATYLRYDLDIVQMGSSPVTHFKSHWHAGDDPDTKLSEKADPRLPSLLLDPVAALDILVETFFPEEFELPQ
jgi:hypothetical protein